jgi:(p)ppGpp synthase/HD superfamily hydrolase
MPDRPTTQPLPELPGERFDDAYRFAAALHREQRRKGSGVAYLAHLLAVAALVIEDGGGEDEAIAALLHDAVEDHPERTSFDEVRERFGARVAEIVAACTDTPAEYVGGPKPAWRPRKEAFVERIRAGLPAQRVALADKLHNARSILTDLNAIGEAVWQRFSVPREETLWYYRAVARAFREAGARGPMLGELERAVAEMHRLSGLDARSDGRGRDEGD